MTYAIIYTDTIKKCRVWFFYDTSEIVIKSLLYEVFNNNNVLEKQIFLSNDYWALASQPNWEYLDFLRGGADVKNKSLKKNFKKEFNNSFPQFSNYLSKLLKKYPQFIVRYSMLSIWGSWERALQVNGMDKHNNIYDWMTIEQYGYTKNDNFKTVQVAQSGRERYRLTRTISNNKLIYMETSEETGSFFRRYNYNNQSKLEQIIEGSLMNDTELIEKIIFVVPIE